MTNILVLGPQGSGKGTMAALLSKHIGIPHLDAGQLLRDEIQKNTKLGKQLAQRMNKGLLVPDKTVIKIVESHITKLNCKNGYILDGFPRTLNEAELLDEITTIDLVFNLQISDALAIKRLSARRICPKCHRVYGNELPPKKAGVCDTCKSKLIQREDDTPPAIKKRLAIYHEETEPLLEYYRPRDIVKDINATPLPEKILKKILAVMS